MNVNDFKLLRFKFKFLAKILGKLLVRAGAAAVAGRPNTQAGRKKLPDLNPPWLESLRQ